MANTTFNGAVRSENGFKAVQKDSTLGTFTDYVDIKNDGGVEIRNGDPITGRLAAVARGGTNHMAHLQSTAVEK